MNLDEFIDKFAKLAPQKKWYLQLGAIRSKDGECPITAFSGQDAGRVGDASELLGLDPNTTSDIVRAADGRDFSIMCRGFYTEYDTLLRNKLLKATGLEEQPCTLVT